MGEPSSLATSHGFRHCSRPSVAKALVDTLPIPLKLVQSCLTCREMEGEERCRMGWFVLSSSPRPRCQCWLASVMGETSCVF